MDSTANGSIQAKAKDAAYEAELEDAAYEIELKDAASESADLKIEKAVQHIREGKASDQPCGSIQAENAADEDAAAALESADLNIEEAVQLIREGKDNDQPCKRTKFVMIAYAIVHHPFYYLIHFLSSLALMALAFWEQAAVPQEENSREEKAAYLATEIPLLLLIGINLILKLFWRGPKAFIKSRSILIILVLLLMFFDVLIILGRNQRHLRVIRALRPLLLLDTHLMTGARRIIRQMILCGKYIIDLLLILFFLIALAALSSYCLFADTDPTYFEDLSLSFVSTFIAMTTANHPDVFMEAYMQNVATPIFFVVFFIITSYCFINLLSVVIVKFKNEAEQKYKALHLHRRKALGKAYEKLVNTTRMPFSVFLKLMDSYQPQLAEYEVMCIYKDLQENMDTSQGLSTTKFQKLFKCLGLKWQIIDHTTQKPSAWYIKCTQDPSKIQKGVEKIHLFINHWSFKTFMTFCILCHLLLLMIPSAVNSSATTRHGDQLCVVRSPGVFTGLFLFNFLYVVEVTIRLLLDGVHRYFRKWWNWFDLVIVFGAFICLCIEGAVLYSAEGPPPYWLRYLVIIRPVILIRLLKMRNTYFHLVKVASAIAYRLYSIFFLMVCMVYTFAIIGMEAFGGEENTVYPGCCVNASFGVGRYFSDDNSSVAGPDIFWLNNFQTLYSSFVTLYELMVVNNWHVIMEGFVSTTSWAARVYFILFWIANIVVINVSTAYILDGFELFFTDLTKKNVFDGHIFKGLKKTVFIVLTNDDKKVLDKAIESLESSKARQTQCCKRWSLVKHKILYGFPLWWKKRSFNCQDFKESESYVKLRGVRPLSDDDLSSVKYSSKLHEWEESEQHDDQSDEDKESSQDEITACQRVKNAIKKLIDDAIQKLKDAVIYVFK